MNVDFPPGTHVAKAAEQLVDARLHGGVARGTFNDIELVADAGTTADDLVRFFEDECSRRAEAWRLSPEGQRHAAEQEQRRQHLQAYANILMEKLDALDFSDDAVVLDWLVKMQMPSDHIGVDVDPGRIIRVFSAHGWLPDVNTGAAFREDDRENFARYLAGQALANLEYIGAIHQIVHEFARQWRERFLGRS